MRDYTFFMADGADYQILLKENNTFSMDSFSLHSEPFCLLSKKLLRRLALALLMILPVLSLYAQNSISYSGDRNYSLVERTDLSRYDNGKYSGLVSREVRSFITRSNAASSNAFMYDGNFFLTEQTVHAKKEVFNGIHDSIPSVFTISNDGKLTMINDNGFPSFRSFPAFPQGKIEKGSSWQADAVRAVDPLNKGIVTHLPMVVAYTFAGEETYHGQDVYRITAKWATRYDLRHIDVRGDKSLKAAMGTHEANILVSKVTGTAILIHDRVDETFSYDNGLNVRLKGTISQFTEYPPTVEHKVLIPALQRIAKFVPKKDSSGTGSIGETGGGIGFSASGTGSAGGRNTFGDSTVIAKNTDGYGNATNTSAIKSVGNSTVVTKNETFSQTAKNTPDNQKSAENIKTERITTDDIRTSVLAKSASADVNSADNKDEAVETSGSDASEASMVVEETPAGLRLSVRELRFKADSADILPDEISRLDQIAEVLKLAPNSHFLIEGHSASVGNPRGELEISEKRAKAIAEQLSKRGIASDRFICRGYGAERPIANNSTTKGKALNRRVEITILE